jgi:alkane 1-monooxygenase
MYAYIGPFLALASVPAFFLLLGPAGPFVTVALLLAFLIGAEWVSRRGPVPDAQSDPRAFRLLPVLYVPAQLGVTLWAIDAAARAGAIGFFALLFAIGITTGVFGMLAAHELVHGRSRAGQMLGGVMLTGMCYRHFRIAHIHGHHRYAGTVRDSATARLGEGFYAFLVRTVAGQTMEAWRHEQRRSAVRHSGLLGNRVLRDAVLMAAIFGAIFALWGWRGDAFFAGESAIGVVVLELFNYIAHYGLVRRIGTRGFAEPFGERHSWNSSNILANTLIFNMGRHSDHHRRPAASYQDLRYMARAPELPAGYAGSILLALAPPLWRKVMDPAVMAVRADGDAGLAFAVVAS